VAASVARAERTAALLKSIFLPGAGLVDGAVASGSPDSCTIADEESGPVGGRGASLRLPGTCGDGLAIAPVGVTASAPPAAAAIAATASAVRSLAVPSLT